MIKNNAPGFIFKDIVIDILVNGRTVHPRGLECKEIIGYSKKISDIHSCAYSYKSRGVNWKYLAAELLWYLSGDLGDSNIKQFAELWGKVSSEEGFVNSNYGNIVFHKVHHGKSQYQIILDEINGDLETRQAIIRYNTLEHQYFGNKDKPCTLTNQFFVRDGKVDMIVNMRSNDAFYGFQYDIIWASLLLQSVAYDLRYFTGDIFWNVGSMHIYENMYKKANTVANSEILEVYSILLEESLQSISKTIKENSKELWQELFRIRDTESIDSGGICNRLYMDFIRRNFKIIIEKSYG